ncbi:MAG TPA: hypothetical protein VES20_08965 [Bryobacteraceae bacterium]|nr:hypothetical protein [Bryobacteraceae bacterium]
MKYLLPALFAGAVLVCVAVAEYSGSYVVPLDHEAVGYAKATADDPVARLNRKLTAAGKLRYEEDFGYLRSTLKALNIPVESQVLVFSKTSFQAAKISPAMPRAIYFNDSVSVGYVRGGDVLEVIAVDPKHGAMFYTLDQDPAVKAVFERRDASCLQCHASGATAGVPGFVVRSVYPEPNGMPLFQAGSFVTDHRSPFKERWGGWYVTGNHGDQKHMGNAFVRSREKPDALDTEGTQNVVHLQKRFDAGAYLTPHSDIVALMTLEHQSRISNVLTRLAYETRMALHSGREINRILGKPEDEIGESAERRIGSGVNEAVRYMLFSDESRLTAPVSGTSGFSEIFSAVGPKDPKGRSLRDFELKTRMFRYPLSYMIYSESFEALPVPAKDRLYRKLLNVLSGKDTGKEWQHLTGEDREAIREILVATKPQLPAWFR